MSILHYPQAAKNNGHDHLQTEFALLPPLWWEEEKGVECQGLSTRVMKLSYHFEYLFPYWAFTWLLWTFDYFQDYKASLAPVCFSNVSVGEQGPGVSYSTSFWCHSKWALLLFFFIISSILMYLCSSNSLPSYLRCKAFWNVTDCQWRRDMISTQCDKYHERSLQSMTKLARAPGSKLRTVPLTVFALLVSFLGNVHWETGRFGFHDFPGFIALSGTDNVFSTQKNHVICPGQRTDESWA